MWCWRDFSAVKTFDVLVGDLDSNTNTITENSHLPVTHIPGYQMLPFLPLWAPEHISVCPHMIDKTIK